MVFWIHPSSKGSVGLSMAPRCGNVALLCVSSLAFLRLQLPRHLGSSALLIFLPSWAPVVPSAPFTSRLHPEQLFSLLRSFTGGARLPRGARGCGANWSLIFRIRSRADALLDPVDFSTTQKCTLTLKKNKKKTQPEAVGSRFFRFLGFS